MVGLVTRPLAIWLVGLGLLVTTAGCKGEKDAKAEGAKASCDAQASEKKLAGAAKNSFVKKCVADASA